MKIIIRSKLLKLLILLLFVAACAKTEKPTDENIKPLRNPNPQPAVSALQKTVAAIDAQLGEYESVDGQFANGPQIIRFSAFFSGDSLKTIVENRKLAAGGTAEGQFYFANGEPVFFREVQHLGDGNGNKTQLSQQIFWGAGGNIISAERTVADEPEASSADESTAIKDRAALLYQTAFQQRMSNNRPR